MLKEGRGEPAQRLLRLNALLADTEAAEDDAEQVVGAEFARDTGKLVLRQSQFLGQQVERNVAPRCMVGGRGQVAVQVVP